MPFEFRELAVFDDPRRQGVERSEPFEHVLVCARSRFGPFEDRKLELLEQHASKLDRRVDVEFAAGFVVDLPDEGLQPFGELFALLFQFVGIDANARRLHLGQHADQRPLEVPIQVPELFSLESLFDAFRQLEGDLRSLRRRIRPPWQYRPRTS